MGTLMGHVLPGSFFIAASMWWLWVLLHRYFKARLPKGKASAKYEFKSSLSVACPCTGSRFPLLGVVIISLVGIGIIGKAYDPSLFLLSNRLLLIIYCSCRF
jgi:hypothetical protein